MNDKIHIACGQNKIIAMRSCHVGGHGGTFAFNEYNIPLIITVGDGFEWDVIRTEYAGLYIN